jgi:transposase
LIKDLPEGAMLLADKGYDANALRNAVIERKAWANIPPKANRKAPICFSPFLYKARNQIERFFNKVKQFRRIATRYDKLAENYLAALKLVAIRIWLRSNESTSYDSAPSTAGGPLRLACHRAMPNCCRFDKRFTRGFHAWALSP